MTMRAPIQVDLEGIYHDVPRNLIAIRKNRRVSEIIENGEVKRRRLLESAKGGDLKAIQTLRDTYKIRSYIHMGKKII